MAPAASAPATSGGAISTIFRSSGFMPYFFRTRKTISRSSEKRLGIAIVRPLRSGNVFTGPSFRTTTALP